MDPLVVPMGLLAGVGAVLSHLLGNRRVAKARREFFARHTRAVSQLADAAIEVMAVEYGADLEDAMKKLMVAAKERNPAFVGLMPQGGFAEMRAHIAKLRAAKEKPSAPTTES